MVFSTTTNTHTDERWLTMTRSVLCWLLLLLSEAFRFLLASAVQIRKLPTLSAVTWSPNGALCQLTRTKGHSRPPVTMNAETAKIKNRLSSLTSSFDELETLLEPLFAQTLPETLVGLEPLQQAKLQTVLPYVVYDLIFSVFCRLLLLHAELTGTLSVYLKSRGIDPKTHPVIPELVRMLLTNFIHHNQLKHTDIQDRIRQYFEKINNAENPPASERP